MSLRPQAKTEMPFKTETTETERSANALGVEAGALKPIQFMNSAHHRLLLEKNLLDETLAKQLEAYKHVTSAQE